MQPGPRIAPNRRLLRPAAAAGAGAGNRNRPAARHHFRAGRRRERHRPGGRGGGLGLGHGTKTDTPLVETPQTVYVVPAGQVAETGAKSLPDALAYTPGVSQTYGWTMRTGDQVQMRGFEIWNTLRDGMTYQVNTYDGQQETYGLERIEVLKGATSVLYGNLRPGGW